MAAYKKMIEEFGVTMCDSQGSAVLKDVLTGADESTLGEILYEESGFRNFLIDKEVKLEITPPLHFTLLQTPDPR